MRTSTRFLAGLAAAGVVAAGGSAFTAAGTGVDAHYASFDEAAVSGVTVTNIAYNTVASVNGSAADASRLSSIVFSVTESVPDADYDQVLTVTTGRTNPTTAQYTCDYAAGVASAPNTLTCAVSSLKVEDVDKVSLSVTPHHVA